MSLPFDNTLANTLLWFALAKAEPSNIDQHTQIGVHLEEVGEMLDSMTALDMETRSLLGSAIVALDNLANHLKGGENLIAIEEANRVEYLDSLCDQVVTATGCASLAGFKFIEAMNEVNRSNFSKFGEDGQPILDANRKVMKGPNYTKAELTAFVP